MNRLLTGLKIGISLSETDDMVDYGFQGSDIAPFTVSLSKRLISLGAAVVLGHQWRPNGIMDSVVRFAELYRSEAGSPQAPILYNLLAAPDTAQISAGDRERLKPLLEIRDSLRSPGSGQPRDTKDQRRSDLSWMRAEMTAVCDARICLGGKTKQRNDRTHGVIEEAALAVEQRQPLYLCGLLKGSTKVMIDLLQDNLSVERATVLLSPGDKAGGPTACHPFTAGFLEQIAGIGEAACAGRAGLEVERQRDLFRAQSVDEMLSLIVPALTRMRSGNANFTLRNSGS